MTACRYGQQVSELAIRCVAFAVGIQISHKGGLISRTSVAAINASVVASAQAVQRNPQPLVCDGTRRAFRYAASKRTVDSVHSKNITRMHAAVACAALRVLVRQVSGGQLSFGGRAEPPTPPPGVVVPEDFEAPAAEARPGCTCPFEQVNMDVTWQACNVSFLQNACTMRMMSTVVNVRARDGRVHMRLTLLPPRSRSWGQRRSMASYSPCASCAPQWGTSAEATVRTTTAAAPRRRS